MTFLNFFLFPVAQEYHNKWLPTLEWSNETENIKTALLSEIVKKKALLIGVNEINHFFLLTPSLSETSEKRIHSKYISE